jgi:serine/threonine protein kinase
VKRLRCNYPKAFKHESTVLWRLLKEPHVHPHLVTLLATFEQREQYYFILPWAESDLESYWKDFGRFKNTWNDEQMSAWLVRQCQGIVEALSRIHRYDTTSGTTISYHKTERASVSAVRAKPRARDPAEPRTPLTLFGRHGDIKPQNILWFHNPCVNQDLGTLKISDFGSARFGDRMTMSEEHQDSMAMSLTYRSPECQMPDAEPSIQCDIWALGCVFLEFVCWYHASYDGLKDFARQRRYGYDSDSYFTIGRVNRDERRHELYATVKKPVTEVS